MFYPKYNPLFNDQSNFHIPIEFCAFVHSNPNNPIRNNFFHFLCKKYKKVNSYGKLLNNMGKVENLNWAGEEQIELLSRHKFVLCFENSRNDLDYYITEKLINAKLSGAIPVYWGTKKCLEIFEPDSFLFLENDNEEGFIRLVNQIIDLDTNNDKFLEMRNKKLIQNDKIQKYKNTELKLLLNL